MRKGICKALGWHFERRPWNRYGCSRTAFVPNLADRNFVRRPCAEWKWKSLCWGWMEHLVPAPCGGTLCCQVGSVENWVCGVHLHKVAPFCSRLQQFYQVTILRNVCKAKYRQVLWITMEIFWAWIMAGYGCQPRMHEETSPVSAKRHRSMVKSSFEECVQ